MEETKLNRTEISKKIENAEPFNITFKYTSNEVLMMINSTIAKTLSKMDHLFLLNSFVTIIREVIVNAQKANVKRIFFKMNDLDLQNPDDYALGMRRFKDEIIGDFEIIEEDVRNSDYYIDIFFETIDEDLHIIITNNTPILPEELERINYRIEKATVFNDFTEAYDEIQDETEGAGLGIVLTILFLKSMGIDPKSFNIETDGKVTKTKMVVPKVLRPSSITSTVKEQIVNEIEGIPTFPENVLALQSLCSDPEASIDEISDRIMMDPALVADVIKLSNSAGFVTSNRIDSVHTAVMTIGLKNVNAILVASNARRILNERYTSFERIWDHCNKTAFYARMIALEKKLHGVTENAFMAGLLHDLGKIVLLSTDMELVKKIANQVKDRKIITSTIMEEISIGISHSTIGGLIAEKWNFPESLVEAMQYHHSPLRASEEYKNLVYTVYLANMLIGIEDRKYTFYYFDESILKHFDLLDEKKFSDFHQKMKDKYDNLPE
ncbi:MAG: HDOD domain-containing protein [bacterium]|nr:HDOD domain-containing protein [bacterium]